MQLLRSPPNPRWAILCDVIVVIVVYSLLLVLLGFVAPTDYPHQPGDWHRDLRKVFIAVAMTWLIWRWSHRSLDRGRKT